MEVNSGPSSRKTRVHLLPVLKIILELSQSGSLELMTDYLSRVVDYDNYMLNPAVFQWLDSLWGPHTVDGFADPKNAQVERFNSRFWAPGTDAVDAFTCNWAEENNWWFPSTYLIPRVITHAQRCSADGTLTVPQWPSSFYWPLLFPNGIDPVEFVVEYTELPCIHDLILPGQLGASLFRGLLRIRFQEIN